MKRFKGYSKTYGNKYIMVSDEDYELAMTQRWTIEKSGNNFYAMCKINHKKVRLHRFLLKPKSTHEVDHINHNGLDNRRENIRVVTKRQNAANRRKTVGSRKRYKGIHYDTRINKWVAYVNYKKKRKYLGQYATAKEAAIVYNEAALKYYGKTAWVNKIIDNKK